MSEQPIFMQIVLSVIAFLILERIVGRLRARQMGLGIVGIWSISTLIFLFFVWKPAALTQIAAMLGIGRGVDAAMYVSVTASFYIILRLMLRIEKQENNITRLVSEIALLKNDIDKKK